MLMHFPAGASWQYSLGHHALLVDVAGYGCQPGLKSRTRVGICAGGQSRVQMGDTCPELACSCDFGCQAGLQRQYSGLALSHSCEVATLPVLSLALPPGRLLSPQAGDGHQVVTLRCCRCWDHDVRCRCQGSLSVFVFVIGQLCTWNEVSSPLPPTPCNGHRHFGGLKIQCIYRLGQFSAACVKVATMEQQKGKEVDTVSTKQQ